MNSNQPKILILRLSSLGDVIIATSALEVTAAAAVSSNTQVDWVVAREYSEVLKTHPQIRHVYELNRSLQFKGWFKLCQQLWDLEYDQIYDLHGSLRTRIMRVLFYLWALKKLKKPPLWKTVSKQRLRFYGYYLFKKLWPRPLRPTPGFLKFSLLLGGTGQERPNLKHLLKEAKIPQEVLEVLNNPQILKNGLLCIMPSSKWKGKNWPVEKYVEVIKVLQFYPVILGTSRDAESLDLCDSLSKLRIPFLSGVGRWSLTEIAGVLANSRGLLGGDTGLAHLAEAVGVSVTTLFGPTSPDMGFGPWRTESKALGIDLICRPCGKDGRYCYRFGQRYQCLKALLPKTVIERFEKL